MIKLKVNGINEDDMYPRWCFIAATSIALVVPSSDGETDTDLTCLYMHNSTRVYVNHKAEEVAAMIDDEFI